MLCLGYCSDPNPHFDSHRAPQNLRKSKDEGPSPENLGFYKAVWKDCLEDAKHECRMIHALNNPFPSKSRDLNTSIMESLVSIVIEWEQHNAALEPGKLVLKLSQYHS